MTFMKNMYICFIISLQLLLRTHCHITLKEMIASEQIKQFELFLELIILIELSDYLLGTVVGWISGFQPRLGHND